MAGRPAKKLTPRTEAERIGAAIRCRREGVGKSVRQIEVAAGLGVNQLYAIERGKPTSIRRLLRIATILDCTAASLLP